MNRANVNTHSLLAMGALLPQALLACAILLTSYGTARGGPILYAPYVSYDAGMAPTSVDITDLNGDGKLDLVVANYGVAVLLGDGTGTFGPDMGFQAPVLSRHCATGDFNLDGNPDLVTVQMMLANGGPYLRLGNGDGTFGEPRSLGVPHGTGNVLATDLNADGRLDVVAASRHDSLYVLLGYGDGTFGAATAYKTVAAPPCLAVGDLNGDGVPDLAAGNKDSNIVSILLGNGDGTFGLRRNVALGARAHHLALGDLNADAKLDLVVAGDLVRVLIGNGDATFDSPMAYGSGAPLGAVLVVDFNSDGKPDLAATRPGSGLVSLFPGVGDGTFGPQRDAPAGSDASGIASMDFNSDGRADIVTTNPGPGTVSLLLGNGDGSFGKTVELNVEEPTSLVMGDLNLDGRADIVATNGTYNRLSVMLGTADGFARKRYFDTGSNARSVALGLLNQDTTPDIVVANEYSGSASVLLGNNDGTLRARVDYSVGGSPTSIAIADLNADGHQDAVVAPTAWGISVLLGRGDGTFGITNILSIFPNSIAIADVNADGRPDLVGTLWSSNAVSILLGNGDATFAPWTNWPVGNGPMHVAMGDLNNDAKLDLVVANHDGYSSMLLGRGDGTFSPRIDSYEKYGLWFVSIVDLNADGTMDLATASEWDHGVAVRLGKGDGTFGPRTHYGTGLDPICIASGDVDGDGKPDLAVANSGSSTVSVLRSSNSTPKAPLSISVTEARGEVDRARLTWYVPHTDGAVLTAERRTATEGWVALTNPVPDPHGYVTLEDTDVAPGARYGYRLALETSRLHVLSREVWIRIPDGVNAPGVASLAPGHPSPFRETTRFRYNLPAAGLVRLSLYDVRGRLVSTLVKEQQPAGIQSVSWNGTGRDQRGVASGVYYARLEAAGHVFTSSVVVAR